MFDVWLALLVMALHFVWAIGVANCSARSGTPVVPALSVIYTTLLRTLDTFEGSVTTKTQPDGKSACQLSNQGSCSEFADHWWVRQREVEKYDASACLMGKSAQFFFTYLVQPSVADVDRFWGHVFV